MSKRFLVFLACMAFIGGGVAYADDVADACRSLVEAHGKAVVSINLVISQSYAFGGTSEREDMSSESKGCVVGPDGLTLMSLSETDPMSFFSDMWGGDEDMQMDAKLSKVEIVLPDGKEVPAKIVLRDEDLDLAFLRPEQPVAAPWEYIDLTAASKAEAFDRVILLSRLGKVGQKLPTAQDTRIAAVQMKPRHFYLLGEGAFMPGAPAFAMDGSLLGITILRKGKLDPDSMGLSMIMGGGMGGEILTAILPAEAVNKIAVQAPQEAAKEEAPADAPADDASAPSEETAPAEVEAP